MANWDDQGRQYSEFVEAELAAEGARRDSVNSRAATALTGSAGLVTLVLAVFTVFIGKEFTLSGWPKWFLAMALIALLAAALCAVVAGVPWIAPATKAKTLHRFRTSRWGDTEVTARGMTAYCNAVGVERLRPGTRVKFYFLLAAHVCQAVAIAGLVVCTLGVVFDPSTLTAIAPQH